MISGILASLIRLCARYSGRINSASEGKSRVKSFIGTMEMKYSPVFLINDGQHRKAAIEAAMEEDSSLGKETISIVFYRIVNKLDEFLPRISRSLSVYLLKNGMASMIFLVATAI